MKSFKDYCQEEVQLDEGFVWTAASTAGLVSLVGPTAAAWIMIGLALATITAVYSILSNGGIKKIISNFKNTYTGKNIDVNALTEYAKKVRQSLNPGQKGYITQYSNKIQKALEDKDYGTAGSLLKELQKYVENTKKKTNEEVQLDEGIYLVGTYTNPSKEHIRVWQHSPAGYHYSIENTKNKKILQHHGSLESAVSRHKLELVKEEEDKREYAPNVPTWIRNRAEKRYGHYVNVVGNTEAVRRKKYKQDHDDEAAIERAAARRKGW